MLIAFILASVAIRNILDWPLTFWEPVKYILLAAGVALVGLPLAALAVSAFLWLAASLVSLAARWLLRALRNSEWHAKVVGLMLLMFGVHFDLLAG